MPTNYIIIFNIKKNIDFISVLKKSKINKLIINYSFIYILNFIDQKIEADIAAGKHGGRVHTRFPPEPNGHLHIGHAKAICVSFGLAEKYGGVTNLRFDDTNPEKESTEYVNAIREDVVWLGFDWKGGEFYTSDYFEQLYGFACQLIKLGKAYVDDQSSEEMAAQKGAPGKPGKNSPFRDRDICVQFWFI